MKKQTLIMLGFISTLAACGGTQQPQSSEAPSNRVTSKETLGMSPTKALKKEKSKKFVYDPQGREEFVFDEVPKVLQEYAYKDFCYSIPDRNAYECTGDQLDYEYYYGKRGYYTDKKPIRKGQHLLREAILENGLKIYAISSTKFSHVGKDRIPLKDFMERKNFVAYPIVEGATAMVTGYSKNLKDQLMISTNKDASYSEDAIKAIQRVAAQHPKNGAKIADLMTTLRVKYDDFEGRTTISGFPYNNEDSYISLRMVIPDDGRIIPVVDTHYEAQDWLFVKSYSVKADDFKWRSSDLTFKRDNASGKIWEWNNSILTDDTKTMLNAIASAETATVRFQGRYYDDYTVTAKQQAEIRSLLKILELTK
jgi:hypothetical protein